MCSCFAAVRWSTTEAFAMPMYARIEISYAQP
jgi:hypothetical protein